MPPPTKQKFLIDGDLDQRERMDVVKGRCNCLKDEIAVIELA